uniref:Large ribosomal subunit protein uL29 n=1 Tax=uncultured Chloroflexi bacterium Rifle_16ft_4_minimus_38663 TaxID=1665074 RepID=A0A0H4T7P7_9CHLR|nr:50S ribosomal protein L29, large subunit ribosomal protein L29 [uncultured Chloroflexi bacterium Rifle_16ft_4_minimus_38663]
MKSVKTSELRNLKSGEIETKLTDAQEELMKLRFQQVTGQLTDTSRLRILRREIARMQTIVRAQTTAEAVEGEA